MLILRQDLKARRSYRAMILMLVELEDLLMELDAFDDNELYAWTAIENERQSIENGFQKPIAIDINENFRTLGCQREELISRVEDVHFDKLAMGICLLGHLDRLVRLVDANDIGYTHTFGNGINSDA
ncbi:hypothetical protein Ae201684_014503 [Aphanomyces euteiches]|uniref:Uncharacterized protein n=1 Tax=Aphanomyces euteiches TaxID=100861 RepID=A0A6G0WJR0_9STRA|nr:hypothetical protein Ae201684_014503 [Aphanomyces euteiches]